MSLELILQVVPCEAGSVLRGSINDPSLKFVAAAGPVGDRLVGKELPFGEGIVGLCFDIGIAVQVNDVSSDERHFRAFDDATGFRTRDTLCVPIKNEHGAFGAVQLINPAVAFETWQVDAVEQIVGTLATALSGI